MGKNPCIARNCKNNREKCPHLRFHTIPVRSYDRWITILDPSLFALPRKRVLQRHVCSEHFTEKSYNLPGKRGNLVYNAVPSINITPVEAVVHEDIDDVAVVPGSTPLIQEVTLHSDSSVAMQVENSPVVTQVEQDHAYFTTEKSNDAGNVAFQLATPTLPATVPDHREYASKFKAPRSKAKIEPATIRVPRDQRTPLVVHLLASVSKYKLERRTYKNKYHKKCNELKALKSTDPVQNALECLRGKMSPRLHKLLKAEVRNFNCAPTRRSWTKSELAEHETMKQRGPKCYRGLPFTKPSRKTLRQVIKKLHVEPGLNPVLLEILKKKIQEMPPEERICSIVFDEMAIKTYLTLLKDIVAGYVDIGNGRRKPDPAEEILVPMLRSTYGSWKLPLAYYLTDKKFTGAEFKQIFQEVIEAVLDVGAEVRALITDGLQKNITAMQMLGAWGIEHPFFFLKGRKIVTIVDPPHVMKSFRNALLLHLLSRPDGTLIDIKYIKAFILHDMEQEVRLAKKLTPRHVNPGTFDKQNVNLAAQLFSKTTGSGVMAYTSMGLLPHEAMETGRFCELMNNFFDSFNGTNYVENPAADDFKCALSSSSAHLGLWDQLLGEMQHWQFLGTTRVQVMNNWQRTLNGFKILWTDLQAEGHKYLPVGHINQDCEENLFSGIRGNLGANGTPSAAEVPATFMRSVVKNLTAVSKGKNCRDDEAISLVSMEELIEAIESRTLAQGPETAEDLILYISEELYPDPDQPEGEETDQNNNPLLARMASAKLASPHLKKLITHLDCHECKALLQTEPQYPLHLDHIMTAGVSDITAMLPGRDVAEAVRAIGHVVKLSKPSFHLEHILTRIEKFVITLPEVQSMNFCPLHNEEFKPKFVKSIVKEIMEDNLKKENIKLKEKNKRNPEKQNQKLQRMSHQ